MLAKRKKRYRRHVYSAVAHEPERVVRHKKTDGNREYVTCLDALDADRRRQSAKRPTALSLFSGCGGLSLGTSWAGFDVQAFLEIDERLKAVYRLNFPEVRELGGDVTALSDVDIKQRAQELPAIDLVVGGPPCQGFSLAGKRAVGDTRNVLFREFMRFIDAFRPKVAIMENVRLLTSMRSQSGELVKLQILRDFDSCGYRARLFEVNAKDYGVPQHRERVFFVATRADLKAEPSFPQRPFGGRPGLFGGTRPHRTFADACSDLSYLESGDKDQFDALHEAVAHPQHVVRWLWDVPEGFSAHQNEDPRKRPPSGYNTTYKRQVWNEPASTVQTTFGMISGCRNVHPIATRALTVREAARLQSFPDSYRFGTHLGSMRVGIGNAVPPLLAYAVAKHVKDQVLEFVEVPSL